MATKNQTKVKPTDVKGIKPKTPEMAVFLMAGYPDMTVDKAKQIIKERQENPALWPYQMLERAQAFLAAYETQAVAVDTEPGWKRKE